MEMSQNATVSSTNPKVSSINPTALLTLLFGELHNLKLFRLSKHMQDQDFHLKNDKVCVVNMHKSPIIIAWAACGTAQW